MASDQHPDHDVQAGECLIAEVYMRIKRNPDAVAEHGAAGAVRRAWRNVLIASPHQAAHLTSSRRQPIAPERHGVQVRPTRRASARGVLISPWIPKNTVVEPRCSITLRFRRR